MPTFVIRLSGPRPNFALDMSEEERATMGRHAAHWQPFIEAGCLRRDGARLWLTRQGMLLAHEVMAVFV